MQRYNLFTKKGLEKGVLQKKLPVTRRISQRILNFYSVVFSCDLTCFALNIAPIVIPHMMCSFMMNIIIAELYLHNIERMAKRVNVINLIRLRRDGNADDYCQYAEVQTENLKVHYVEMGSFSRLDTTLKFLPEKRSNWKHIYQGKEHRTYWFHFWMGQKHLVLELKDSDVLKRKDLLAAIFQGKSIDVGSTVEFEEASVRTREAERRQSMGFVDELVTLRRKARDDKQTMLYLD